MAVKVEPDLDMGIDYIDIASREEIQIQSNVGFMFEEEDDPDQNECNIATRDDSDLSQGFDSKIFLIKKEDEIKSDVEFESIESDDLALHTCVDDDLHEEKRTALTSRSDITKRPPSKKPLSNIGKHINKTTGEKCNSFSMFGYQQSHKHPLTEHQRIHTGSEPFSSNTSEFRTTDYSIKMAHYFYLCNICGYKAPSKEVFIIHMKKHTGKKPYSCNICDYRASYKSSLTIHMRTHTGEKPYSCSICVFRTTKKSSLTMHMKTHTGEKSYTCSICDSRVSRKQYLTAHMRTHTGEKPYSCNICDYKATQRGNLVKHMRMHK